MGSWLSASCPATSYSLQLYLRDLSLTAASSTNQSNPTAQGKQGSHTNVLSRLSRPSPDIPISPISQCRLVAELSSSYFVAQGRAGGKKDFLNPQTFVICDRFLQVSTSGRIRRPGQPSRPTSGLLFNLLPPPIASIPAHLLHVRLKMSTME